MSKSKEVEALYKKLDANRKEDFQFRASCFKAQVQDYAKRSRGVERILDSLYKKGAAAAGINLTRIDRLHEQDDAAADLFEATQLEKIVAYVERCAKRRRLMIGRTRFLTRDFGSKKHNPGPYCLILWEADRIVRDVTPVNRGVVDHDSWRVGVRDNTSEILLRAPKEPFNGVRVDVFYDFIWQSDYDGMASMHALLSIDGTYSLRTFSRCNWDPEASAFIGVQLIITQNRPGDNDFWEAGSQETILDRTIRGGCSSKTNSGAIGDQSNLLHFNLPAFPVTAGHPGIATLVLQLIANGDAGARSIIDLHSGSGFGATVPFVILTVEETES